jgi:hypothetical protein
MQVEGIANLQAARILNAPAVDLDSLEGIDVFSIPNRSLCLVRENDGLYRFYAESVAPAVPPNVVQPAPGGVPQDGRWILVSSGGGGSGIGPFDTTVQASASRLADVDTTAVANGVIAEVLSVGAQFVLDKTSSTAADGITVVEPVFGPGRWFRVPGYSRRWAVQAAWFLDPAGDDENSGLTALAPLRTVEELSRRISGATIGQSTVATLAAGTYGRLTLDLTLPQGIVFTVQGTLSTTATGTLSATTSAVPSTNTRQIITNTGGDPAFIDRTRVRLTSGASVGAVSWVTRVIAADSVNTKRFALIAPATQTNPTLVNPAAGNTYAVESLTTTIGRCELRAQGPGRLLVSECNVTISGASEAHHCVGDQGSLAGVRFYSCIFGGSSCLFYEGVVNFVSCSFQSSVVVFNQVYVAMRSSVVTNSPTNGMTLDGGTVLNAALGNCFDGSPRWSLQGPRAAIVSFPIARTTRCGSTPTVSSAWT